MGLKVFGVKEAETVCNAVARQIASEDPAERSFEKLRAPTQQNINLRTPVKTGNLLSKNGNEMPDKHTLVFFNTADYASHVHDGTSRMPPRPYIADGMAPIKTAFPDAYMQDMTGFIEQTFQANKPKMS